MGKQLNFKEELPESCPPSASIDVAITDAWRFVKILPASDEHFASFRALKRENKKKKDECGWASCSLFHPETRVQNLSKLQMFKIHKGMVKLEIPTGSGMSVIGEDGHIHFWAYDTFSPTAHIVKTVAL